MDTIKITNSNYLPEIKSLLNTLEKQLTEIKSKINESMREIDVDDWYLLVEDIEETVEQISAKGMKLISKSSFPMHDGNISASNVRSENAV